MLSPYTPRPLKLGAPLRPSSPSIPELKKTPPPAIPEEEDPSSPEAAIGKRIGNFTLTRVLGQGGMGTVYAGKHAELGKEVAIKILKSELSANPQLVARFFREAHLLSRLRHPRIVDIYDSGSSPELGRYLVMEYLKGESLQEYLQRQGALSPFEATNLACQILDALATVHAAGVLHRDLKPANIYLVNSPEGLSVKLLDFGISKLMDAEPDELKTTTGFVMGTPAYLSPEQSIGRKDISEKADLYAVGTILYEMVAGRRPFVSSSVQKMLLMQQIEAPPAPSLFSPGLPTALEQMILQCLEKHPADRPQSALFLMRELRGLLDGLLAQQNQAVTGHRTEEETPLALLETMPKEVSPASMEVEKQEEHTPLPTAPLELASQNHVEIWLLTAVILAFALGITSGVFFMAQP